MIPQLVNQLKQLREKFQSAPADPPRFRPEVQQLEERHLPATSLLNVWFDGVYGTSPYGPASATVGVSRFDAPTGTESVIRQQPVPGLPAQGFGSAPAAKADGVAQIGGTVFFATSAAGFGTNPYAQDDASTILAVDAATGQTTTFAARNRESLGLSASPDGGLLNVWFDGVYGTSPYGPSSATIGVSRFDPATGAERVIFQQPVPGLPAQGFGSAPVAKPDGVAQVGGAVFFAASQPGVAGNNPYALDDASTIFALDPVTGQTTTLAARNRESLGLAASEGGGLLNVWFDGVYGTSPYGPSSATIGVSRFDPATGAERVIFQQPVPGLPAQGFSSPRIAKPDGVAEINAGEAFFATSVAGFGTNPYAQDDASTLFRLDLATGQATTFATRGRESRGVFANISPSVTIDQAAGQADPTSASPIQFTVQFSDPVTGFDASDVSFAGSTVGGTLAATVIGSGTTYTVSVTGMTGNGTVVASILAGAATDAAGYPNDASTSTDNTVTFRAVQAVQLYAVGSGAGVGSRSMVRVFNSDGTPRFDLFPFEPTFQGGARPAVGDVNGDGVDDIIVGAGTGGAPRVVVFDGATGAQIASFYAYDPSFRSGVHVAVGDVTGDGVAEVVTGAGSSDIEGGGPHVAVFDGRTGATLQSFFAYAPNFRGGVRVAVGTIDGHPRIVTVPGPSGRPEVRVFDPATDAEVTRFAAFDQTYRGGAFVAVVGGSIVVSPDSFTDFSGSVLEDLFPTLPDIDGVATGARASAATLIAPAALLAFNVLPSGPAVQQPAAQTVAVDPGFFGGLRISAGMFQGQTGLFAAAGSGGGGRLRFYPVVQGIGSAVDAPAFGPDFPFSIYVGG